MERAAEEHAGVPLRRVRAGEVRCEEFLYDLKAGPAGGRQAVLASDLVPATITLTVRFYRTARHRVELWALASLVPSSASCFSSYYSSPYPLHWRSGLKHASAAGDRSGGAIGRMILGGVPSMLLMTPSAAASPAGMGRNKIKVL
jgi:hypothetical protein